MRRIVFFLKCCVALFSSIAVGEAQDTSVGSVNYASADFAWGSVGSDLCLAYSARDGGIYSKGPWIVDTNHVESQLFVGPVVIWTNGKGPACSESKGIPKIANLAGATLKLKLKLANKRDGGERDLTDRSRMLFWFQATLPQSSASQILAEAHSNSAPLYSALPRRIVNYVLEEDILVRVLNDQDEDIVLQLTEDFRQWTCLGRNQFDSDRPFIGSAAKYTCARNASEFKTALSNVDLNMGLLIMLPDRDENGNLIGWLNSNAPERTYGFAQSLLILKKFVIMKSPNTP